MKKVLMIAGIVGSLSAMQEMPFAHKESIVAQAQSSDDVIMQKLIAIAANDHAQESDSSLSKRAWLLAYEGKKRQAQIAFVKASIAEDAEALVFFAHDYAAGEFLCRKNNDLANVFNEMVEHIADHKKEWTSLAVDLHMKQLRALNQARSNSWYKKILGILVEKKDDFESTPLPLPHEALTKAYDLFSILDDDSEECSTLLSVWKEGFESLNAPIS